MLEVEAIMVILPIANRINTAIQTYEAILENVVVALHIMGASTTIRVENVRAVFRFRSNEVVRNNPISMVVTVPSIVPTVVFRISIGTIGIGLVVANGMLAKAVAPNVST